MTDTTPLPDPETLYSCTQAAATFGMKERTWRKLFDTRALPLVRLGRLLYVRRSDALHYLATNTIAARDADHDGPGA